MFQDSNPFVYWISHPPGSMFFILLIATGTALISIGLTRWLVDTDAINRKQVQMKAHNEEKEKIIALAEIDVERYRKARKKWERKEEMFKQSQQKMSLQRLKPTCITFVPMIVIFGFIQTLFNVGGVNMPVALSPMNANDVPLIGGMMAAQTAGFEPLWSALVYGFKRPITIYDGWINFTSWYFLCSFGMNTLLQRIFKMQTQATGGMEQMMGGSRTKALEFPDV
ncbi:MAG: EMC3/TMCO1 family protein [Candidatus Lokiarchaeota archaeon]